jgi:hypothetical protein
MQAVFVTPTLPALPPPWILGEDLRPQGLIQVGADEPLLMMDEKTRIIGGERGPELARAPSQPPHTLLPKQSHGEISISAASRGCNLPGYPETHLTLRAARCRRASKRARGSDCSATRVPRNRAASAGWGFVCNPQCSHYQVNRS